MKKAFAIITVAAAMFFAGNAHAQMGINFGYAPQTITTVSNTNDTLNLNGMFLGVNCNLPITNGLCVSVGVQGRYNFMSEKSTLDLGILGSAEATADYSQMLVDVPLLLNYGKALNKDVKYSIFVGPTLSYALFGKTKWTGSASVLSFLNLGTDGEDDWYEDSDKYNKFNVSGTAGLSFNVKGIRLFGGYNMGLVNLSTADNTTRKANNWFVGLGYAL